MQQIRAISVDLDDTLWPIEPVIARADRQLGDWLKQHCPRAAKAYPLPAMRALRERVAAGKSCPIWRNWPMCWRHGCLNRTRTVRWHNPCFDCTCRSKLVA